VSNALAIASVTAVLKDLLDNGLIDRNVSSTIGAPVTISALPPDRVKTGTSDPTQLNLFLYHVAPNQGWSNVGLPSRNGRGERLSNPPLALDLFYLLTAYGKQDFEAEILLGYAMQLLHETPVLTRDAIRRSLVPTSPVGRGLLPPPLNALPASELADQVELIKLTLQPTNTEETSKLWSAIQSNYRPSVAYQASVVLVESTRPAKSPLPVLTRGSDDEGAVAEPDPTAPVPPFPILLAVTPPNRQPSARLGDLLEISGHNLDGASVTVRFTHPLLTAPLRIWRLIEVRTGDTLTASPLSIDERVLHYLVGVPYLDERLRGLVEPLQASSALPPSHRILVDQIVGFWSRAQRIWPSIQLCGDDHAGKRAIAASACASLGIGLYAIRAADIPSAVAEREGLARLWEREAVLSSGALLVDCEDLDSNTDGMRTVLSLTERVRGPIVVTGREPLRDRNQPIIRLDVNKLSASEQQNLW